MKLKDLKIKYYKGRPPKITEGPADLPYLNPDYIRKGSTPDFFPIQKGVVQVEDGDLILLWDGSNAGEFFKGKKGILSSTMVKFDKVEETVDDYLFYSLKLQEPILKSKTAGSGIPHVDKEVLLDLDIYLPEKPLQKAVASILNIVDQAIQKTEQLIAKYERIKTGLMQDLLTRGIDEEGNIRSEETHAFKDSALGRIPVEWETRFLKEVCDYQNGKSFPSSQYMASGISLVKPGNLEINGFVNLYNKHATFIPWIFWKENPGYQVFGNEILMNLTAQSLEDQFLGRVCMTPDDTKCLLNQRIARIIPRDIDRNFLFWQLKGEHFRQHVDLAPKGTKVKHLYNNDLDTAIIPLPISESEQNKIAKILWHQDSLVRAYLLELEKLNEIKTALMQDLITGKVRVDALMQKEKAPQSI